MTAKLPAAVALSVSIRTWVSSSETLECALCASLWRRLVISAPQDGHVCSEAVVDGCCWSSSEKLMLSGSISLKSEEA